MQWFGDKIGTKLGTLQGHFVQFILASSWILPSIWLTAAAISSTDASAQFSSTCLNWEDTISWMFKIFIYKITKKTENVNWFNLGAESVKDHVINGGHIEVEDCEMEALEPSYHFQELLWSPPWEYFEVGMALNHRHFNVSNRWMVLHHCVICRITVAVGRARVLREGEEIRERRGETCFWLLGHLLLSF